MPRSFVRFALTALLSSALVVEAHMELLYPLPINSKYDPQTLEANKDYSMTSPLLADGSNFPCKGYNTPEAYKTLEPTATLEAGQEFTIQFAPGGAKHEGGSCQFSVSYDQGETFAVIHSIEGGCPLEEEYTMPIPSDLPSAKSATFSWTWFNKVGNREMYQNCAIVNIEGSSSTSYTGPVLYRANIFGDGTCNTVEGVDPVFPNPGSSVAYGGSVSSSSKVTQLDNCDLDQSGSVTISPSGSSSSPSKGSASPSPSPLSTSSTRAHTSSVTTSAPSRATIAAPSTTTTSVSPSSSSVAAPPASMPSPRVPFRQRTAAVVPTSSSTALTSVEPSRSSSGTVSSAVFSTMPTTTRAASSRSTPSTALSSTDASVSGPISTVGPNVQAGYGYRTIYKYRTYTYTSTTTATTTSVSTAIETETATATATTTVVSTAPAATCTPGPESDSGEDEEEPITSDDGDSTSPSSEGGGGGTYLQCDTLGTFSLCDRATSTCTPMGSVAPGTQCVNGEIVLAAVQRMIKVRNGMVLDVPLRGGQVEGARIGIVRSLSDEDEDAQGQGEGQEVEQRALRGVVEQDERTPRPVSSNKSETGRRRNAHALASSVRVGPWDDRLGHPPPPPPPPPFTPPPSTSNGQVSDRDRREAYFRHRDEDQDEDPPSRSSVQASQAPSTSTRAWDTRDRRGAQGETRDSTWYGDVGEDRDAASVSTLEEGGRGEDDWVDWSEELRTLQREEYERGERVGAVKADKGKGKEKANAARDQVQRTGADDPRTRPATAAPDISARRPRSTPSAREAAPDGNRPESSKRIFIAPPPFRTTASPRLEPNLPMPQNAISPYVASVPSLVPYAPSIHPSPQPHEVPLVSRTDWRLSSPLRKFIRSSPSSLYARTEETSTKALGHNRLVGVGVETGRIALGPKARGAADQSETWGWKVKVPESEKGTWIAADLYRKRMERLLHLSRAADEESYQAQLARSGTPAEREARKRTVCRASASWLTDHVKLDEIRQRNQNVEEGKREGPVGDGGRGAKIVASFEAEDGWDLSEEQGWAFSAPNSIVRITRAARIDLESDSRDPTGPQPSKMSVSDPLNKLWYVQGAVLEAREEKLVVSFEETDLWDVEESEWYQIDVGLDDSSYHLQEQALRNLYHDPSRQRLRNASHVQSAQEAYLASLGDPSLPPAKPILREWSLQGTDLRELLVPKPSIVTEPSILSQDDENDDLHLGPHSPAPTPDGNGGSHSPSALLDFAGPVASTVPGSALNPSDLITSNQLINSWAKRYMRDDPLVLPGDPELGLNASQTKAVAMAIGEKLSLIQGPPGTGKSQTIVSLIALLKLHFRIPEPILLAAPTHVSTDHLLSLLVRRGLNPLRCGKAAKVSPDVEKWTIEKRQEGHPLWKKLEDTRLECEDLRDAIKRSREVTYQIEEPEARKAAEARDFEMEQRYRKLWRRYIMLEHKLYSSLLATADVFCATALGSGASKVLNMVDFPIVLIDEAAMCTEPVTLVPLMKGAQQVALIGDHKQLPAVVASKEAKNERLHTSLFERLLASKHINSVLLDTQYRMRPAISAFPNVSFYHSALHDAATVSSRPPPPRSQFFTTLDVDEARPSSASTGRDPGSPVPVAFVSHAGPESTDKNSLLNRTEVDLIIEIVGDLLDRNPALDPRDIGIISPYWAQTELLTYTFESGWAGRRLSKILGASRASEVVGVEVNTVDGFQGREKKVVVLSTVRSNRGGWIGFLTDKRRLNVALTRARDALFVVGNETTLRLAAANHDWRGTAVDPDQDAAVWRRFLAWCSERGLVKRWTPTPTKDGRGRV
ncbi:hypothetical protein JCM10212_002486 [Sporobolomyces blumeae]